MSQLIVLMVAEKPSIAQTLAEVLSRVAPQKRKGVSPSSPVYEYRGTFRGVAADFRVTATTGHIYSLDFSQECQNWDRVSPGDLFHADTVRCYDPRARMPEHIRSEAREADVLVLWLDCDREGENICFEVIGEALPNMQPRRAWPEAYQNCVFRAQFSSLAAVDLREAMENLGIPDIRQAHSVDARQEIDLRLGVAFSRLQTLYFRKHFGNQLGKKMVTYGPCQFPTLWFCVQRYCEIESFVPVPFWQMKLTAAIGGTDFECWRVAGEYWVEDEATTRLGQLQTGGNRCKIHNVRNFRSKIPRPLPLNTVSMLRMASDELGLGPGDALHYAEQLYLKGITSYPRTETDRYPENFDLEGTAKVVANPNAPWAEHARQLLKRGHTVPREDGFDAGDHPPITPVKFTANPSQCGGEAGYALYCAICTRFLASISPDCVFDEVEMQLDFAGELFVANSSRCIQRGWLDIDNRTASNTGPADLREYAGRAGEELPVSNIELEEDHTKPPGLLRESELLGLMEKHQIGTDASMATHVSNVQKRAYVNLDENTRRLSPSALGLALAHAYALIDQGLILPSVRAKIENQCNSVAKGLATKEVVIRRTIRIFERKFHNFALKIDRLPLMLAVAYAQEKGGGQVAGDAAGEGLNLWAEAQALQRSITLEALLEERDRVEMDDEEGEIPPADAAKRIVEERSPAVERVQQALEQLGFGSAEPAEVNTKPKAKTKANNSRQPPSSSFEQPVSPPPAAESQADLAASPNRTHENGRKGNKNDSKNDGKGSRKGGKSGGRNNTGKGGGDDKRGGGGGDGKGRGDGRKGGREHGHSNDRGKNREGYSWTDFSHAQGSGDGKKGGREHGHAPWAGNWTDFCLPDANDKGRRRSHNNVGRTDVGSGQDLNHNDNHGKGRGGKRGGRWNGRGDGHTAISMDNSCADFSNNGHALNYNTYNSQTQFSGPFPGSDHWNSFANFNQAGNWPSGTASNHWDVSQYQQQMWDQAYWMNQA